ncbi:hypothetical protein NQD34_006740 [Periophthalmus magnuspinnatus]|nr:hypothetical protein NQD34_006740 [Periophthalmus magnuspinnatus]
MQVSQTVECRRKHAGGTTWEDKPLHGMHHRNITEVADIKKSYQWLERAGLMESTDPCPELPPPPTYPTLLRSRLAAGGPHREGLIPRFQRQGRVGHKETGRLPHQSRHMPRPASPSPTDPYPEARDLTCSSRMVPDPLTVLKPKHMITEHQTRCPFPPIRPGDSPSSAESIVPPSCVVAAVHWEIEDTIQEAQTNDPDPGNGPPGKLFVPDSVRSQVLEWVHNSKFACHPRVSRSLSLLKCHFWWPTMDSDTRAYVQACQVCARAKASHSPPSGLLFPLAVPRRLWSHIALDFVTRLPPSQGNTVILTMVNHFSKATNFIALPKLPTARETADQLTAHVFRLHGIPVDIVSDRGTQFTSQVWRAFCEPHIRLSPAVQWSDGVGQPGPRVSPAVHGRR